jgi:siroheme synthase-like protein
MATDGNRFPLFIDLRGRKAVVVGGGNIACRRIQVLLDFGACVTVIAPELKISFSGITHLARAYTPGDLAGAFLAVAATDNREVNAAVGQEATELGIFVTVADRREECNFFFPAVCTGGGLVAGVVSQGADHKKTARAAQEIRRILEELK